MFWQVDSHLSVESEQVFLSGTNVFVSDVQAELKKRSALNIRVLNISFETVPFNNCALVVVPGFQGKHVQIVSTSNWDLHFKKVAVED